MAGAHRKRIVAWVSAALLAVSMCAVMLMGADVATATPDAPSDNGSSAPKDAGGAAAEKAKPVDSKEDSKAGAPKEDGKVGDDSGVKDPDASEPKAADQDTPKVLDVDASTPTVDPTVDPTTKPTLETTATASAEPTPTVTAEPTPTASVEPTPTAEPDTTPSVREQPTKTEPTKAEPTAAASNPSKAPEPLSEESATADQPGAALADDATSSALVATAAASVDQSSPTVANMRVAIAAAEAPPAPAPAGPTLINIIATLAFTVFDYVNRILQGPPVVPAGSTVRVGRSDLTIDCGNGYTAQTDWYFPTDGTPDKLIYFQHGILATSGFYNVTAAELAERNNAIVVAPSITSNFFACDACNLSSDQMHAAVAALFVGDRAALTDSARVAAAQAGVDFADLPQKFVISGHSAGGQLAAGAAGYFYTFAPTAEKSNLVGVLLFDTSAAGGALAQALGELPPSLPVLHIAANPSFFDTYGDANDVLDAVRPGQFNGVRLVDGSHSDAFRSSTLGGFTQLIVSIGTGFSTPENVEANQVLAQGWIADMYAGTVYSDDPNEQQGVYGPLGTVIDVPTPGVGSGVARAYVLPVPPLQLNPIESIVKALLSSVNLTEGLAPCAEDPSAVFDRLGSSDRRPDADLSLEPRHSTANNALSLDVTSRKGQSVGQQCVHR